MLQQTRAETVTGYYNRFIAAYPDVNALAGAQEDEVLKLWEGLGYYSRARNLLRAARTVVCDMGGRFPRTKQGLMSLSGVGEYTAGAIASIAYGLREPAVDGNQIRVISRIFQIDEDVSRPAGRARVTQCARELLDEARPGDFNQALMRLGATLCKTARPDCSACPAYEDCRARESGCAARLPVRPAPASKKSVPLAVAVAISEKGVLIRRRPSEGLLGGLWEFPGFEGARTGEELARCLAEMGVNARPVRRLEAVEHVFTHMIWKQQGYLFRAPATAVEGCRWADAQGLRAAAMPTAMKRYREAALAALEEKGGEARGRDRG